MLVSSKKFEFGIESAILLHLPQELVANLHAIPLPPKYTGGLTWQGRENRTTGMNLSLITELSGHLQAGLPAFGVTLLLLVAARYLIVLTTPFKPISDIVEQENAAIGVVFGGFLVGVAIALCGTTFGRDQEGGLIGRCRF